MTAEDEQEFDRFLAFAKNDEDEPTEWVGVLKRLPWMYKATHGRR